MPSEIEAWARLNGIVLHSFEADALMMMDIEFIANLPQVRKGH